VCPPTPSLSIRRMSSTEISNSLNGNERFVGIDLLRIVAPVGVVLLHTYTAIGEPGSLTWMIRLRDFSLPVMVMASFFLLTVSLSRFSPSARVFVARRVKRLWIPTLGWTLIYCLAVTFVIPFLFGNESHGLPPPSIFLSGYRHLWYLQFLFLTSIVIFPMLLWFYRSPCLSEDRTTIVILAAVSLVSYSIVTSISLVDVWGDELDLNLQIFLSQSISHLPFVPIAIAFALSRSTITDQLRHRSYRLASIALAIAAAVVHLYGDHIPLTREAFAISVFVVALQPISERGFRFLAPLAANSYGIYILHFLPLQILWIVIGDRETNFSALSLLSISLCIYLGTAVTTVVLRKLPFAEYLLPTVFTTLIPRKRPTDPGSIAAVRRDGGLTTFIELRTVGALRRPD
jgi:peptidoglycan/LPS O-acetylase OafA/YrhL